MKNKAVSFNLDNPKDLKRFKHVQDVNFSKYVKAFIDEDIAKQSKVKQSSNGSYQIKID